MQSLKKLFLREHPTVTLDAIQTAVLQAALSGQNVFFTGSAGPFLSSSSSFCILFAKV
jgi:hypothetical protein